MKDRQALEQLQQACEKLELDLTQQQYKQLLDYVALLVKWNKVYNLTSVREPKQIISRHVLDSLSVVSYLHAETVLDVGSGGGQPGIPLAIVYPDAQVTLLDGNSKKTRFLQQVKAELGLSNVSVVHGRVEQVSLPKFAIITARAFASIDDIIRLAGQHSKQGGSLVLMKGIYPEQELQISSKEFALQDVIRVTVPECDGERHLVKFVKGKN